MTIVALKKTITGSKGGVYENAVLAVTAAKVSMNCFQPSLNVRLSMFKDLETAITPGGQAAEETSYSIDVTKPAIVAAFAALEDAVYAAIQEQTASLADADVVTRDVLAAAIADAEAAKT